MRKLKHKKVQKQRKTVIQTWHKVSLLIITVFIILAIIAYRNGFRTEVRGAGFTTQITTNNYRDHSPQINDKYVVWRGYDGNDYEVFLYSSDTHISTKITNNNYSDDNPQIDNGKIVWQGFDGNDYEIFLFDIQTSITTELTDNNYTDEYPQIDSGIIVWKGGNSADPDIYLYDTLSQSTLNLTSSLDGFSSDLPQIDSGKVVWGEYMLNTHRTQLMLYDIASKSISQITNSTEYNNIWPQIDGNQIVWYVDDPDYRVLLYDISNREITQLSSLYSADNPQISEGKIVWQEYDGNDWEIYLYDTLTSNKIQITNNDYEDSQPEINAGKVVWAGGNNTLKEIFHYNITDKNTTQLTNNTYYDDNPQINSGKVVWRGYDNSIGGDEDTGLGFEEIFLWNPNYIFTPEEQAKKLINQVYTYDFPTNIENSYFANLKKIEQFIKSNQKQAATNQLNAFIIKVKNDYTAGIITRDEHDNLISMAQALLISLK